MIWSEVLWTVTPKDVKPSKQIGKKWCSFSIVVLQFKDVQYEHARPLCSCHWTFSKLLSLHWLGRLSFHISGQKATWAHQDPYTRLIMDKYHQDLPSLLTSVQRAPRQGFSDRSWSHSLDFHSMSLSTGCECIPIHFLKGWGGGGSLLCTTLQQLNQAKLTSWDGQWMEGQWTRICNKAGYWYQQCVKRCDHTRTGSTINKEGAMIICE